jgi:hypothetical protein
MSRQILTSRCHRLNYIHSTVPDFIEELQASGTIAAPPASWNSHIALLMGRILCLKHYPRYPDIDGSTYIRTVWQQTSNQARFIFLNNCVDSSIINTLLDEFHQAAIELQQGVEYRETTLKLPQVHWAGTTRHKFIIDGSPNFISAAMMAGLGPYVEAKLTEDPSLLHDHSDHLGDPLLVHAFLSRSHTDISYACCFIIMLLKHGANPNDAFRGPSIWQYWLHIMHVLYINTKEQSWSEEERRKVEDVFEAFLRHGANLYATCTQGRTWWKSVVDETGDDYVFGISSKKLREHFPRAVPHRYLSGESGDSDEPPFASDPAHHSVQCVIESCFATNDHPGGADRLLHLVKELREKKVRICLYIWLSRARVFN